MRAMNEDLATDLGEFGAIESTVRWLDEATPLNIAYLDLIPSGTTRPQRANDVWPTAVVEVGGLASAYVLRADRLTGTPDISESSLNRLRHNLACRGDAEYLAVWKPGELTLYNLDLSPELPAPDVVSKSAPGREILFQDIGNGVFSHTTARRTRTDDIHMEVVQKAVHQVLFDVLTEVTSALISSPALKNKLDDAISLVGRALFTRFLIDRQIINRKTFPDLYAKNQPESCFDNAEMATATCEWLDDKFNGELLPLSSDNLTSYFRALAKSDRGVFSHLANILHRAPGGQTSFEIYWNTINFAHVPIGLLSQVYEHYAHELFSKGAEQESIYYTPRFIAELMVNEAFAGIQTVPVDRARILDPAAGAGIFLVLCFRRLVAERWKATNSRPDTTEIRRILNEQIFGFDINSSALRLNALSLYLTALELDPNPFPPSKLKFRKLLNHNLIVTRATDEPYPESLVMGSLGDGAPVEHLHQYDLVLGNPPWTAWEGRGSDDLNDRATKLVRAIAAQRGMTFRLNQVATQYQNPDKVPDLPFVWRAMEWAKQDAIIAFALHGRLLFKRADAGAWARDALFSALRVTGILNGADLVPDVWPGINQPFCLLFAKNTVPADSDVFYLVSPDWDAALARQLRFRIDHANAQPVQFSVARANPALLKTLAFGTSLDADVIRRVRTLLQPQPHGPDSGKEPDDVKVAAVPMVAKAARLGDYWTRERGLVSGQGFRPAKKQHQNDARFLISMKARMLTARMKIGLCVDPKTLPRFTDATVHKPRTPEIYQPPLVIISQSPGADRSKVRARLALDPIPIAFNESFFGYSSNGHPAAQDIARYLFVVASSDLFVYYQLMTSAKFGVERRVIYEEDVADFPVIPFDTLSETQLVEIRQLSNAVCEDPATPTWTELNQWVFDLYGIDSSDQQVISDTLATRMPYAKAQQFADAAPHDQDVERFANKVASLLAVFLGQKQGEIVGRSRLATSASWRFIDLVGGTFEGDATKHSAIVELFKTLAHNEGATRVILQQGERRLCVGMLAQQRYWTDSRARLCALDILRHHKDVFAMEAHG